MGFVEPEVGSINKNPGDAVKELASATFTTISEKTGRSLGEFRDWLSSKFFGGKGTTTAKLAVN